MIIHPAPIDIPICYWTKTTVSTIEYKTDDNYIGSITGYGLDNIRQQLGKDYIYVYVPASVWS